MNITSPLRLAVGSHEAGSGRGCAMNIVSWENGDTEITDLPACADPLLARVVQRVNDEICSYGDLLCPDCSEQVLDLAHRTVGTALDMSDAERARAYVRLALDEAESVARDDDDERPTEARRVTAAWLRGEVTVGEVRAAAYAALEADATFYAAAHAANSAAYAADAAYFAATYHATDATYYAADATDAAYYAASSAAYAAYAANDAAADRVEHAHLLIDRFESLTGVRGQAPEPEVTAAAVAAMTEATA